MASDAEDLPCISRQSYFSHCVPFFNKLTSLDLHISQDPIILENLLRYNKSLNFSSYIIQSYASLTIGPV